VSEARRRGLILYIDDDGNFCATVYNKTKQDKGHNIQVTKANNDQDTDRLQDKYTIFCN